MFLYEYLSVLYLRGGWICRGIYSACKSSFVAARCKNSLHLRDYSRRTDIDHIRIDVQVYHYLAKPVTLITDKSREKLSVFVCICRLLLVISTQLFRANYTNFTIGEKFRNFTELYNERGTLWNFTNFTFLGCSLFSAGLYGFGLKQLTKIVYVICYILCYCELSRQVQW